MNAFIARPDPVPASDASNASPIVENDGWFPDIDLNALRVAIRLDGMVTHDRLRTAVVDAIASANEELRGWQLAQRACSHASLAEVPAQKVAGESVHLARYRRAVHHLASADLTERYRDFDATKSGHQRADELSTTIDDARRNARWALNDIRGLPRTTVELI